MSGAAFQDKVCILTGAASGLGLALARQLAAAGAQLVLADIDAESLAAAAAQIAASGGKAKPAPIPVPTDVTDAEAMRRLIEDAAKEFGRIDYLFNNAGCAVIGEIRDLTLQHWRRVIEINLFGEIHGIHYAYPIMIRQGFGHIVNVASGFGMAPGPLNTPYVASKFGVFGLSHALAAEARDFGIAVSVVCPGYIDTPLVATAQPLNADAAALRAQIAVKLVPAEEAAKIILAGVLKRQRVIAFPGYVRLLAFLHRFLPGLFDLFSAKQIKDFRGIRKAPAD